MSSFWELYKTHNFTTWVERKKCFNIRVDGTLPPTLCMVKNCYEDARENEGTAPHILNLSNRWWLSTVKSLCTQIKNPPIRTVCEFGLESTRQKNINSCQESNSDTLAVQSVAQSPNVIYQIRAVDINRIPHINADTQSTLHWAADIRLILYSPGH